MTDRPGLPLGRFLGAPVYLAPSWFVIALVVVVLFAPTVERSAAVGPPVNYGVAALYAVLLLLSVLVHEFAHAAAARGLGLPVHQIVANLWGGHTQYGDESPTAGRSAVVAVVGPLANGVVTLLGLWLLRSGLAPAGGVTHLLVVALVISNGFVAAFNLAPGLPLDGGRVVESAVWAVTGRRSTGTLVAGWCGRLVAVAVLLYFVLRPLLLGVVPDLFTLVWSVLIAAMLWQGATSAIAVAQVRSRAGRLRLGDLVDPATALPADDVSWLRRDPGATGALVALDDDGRPIGVADPGTLRAVLSSPSRPREGTPLRAVVTVLDPVAVLPADADGERVLQALATTPAYVYVVVDRAGAVVGLAPGDRLAEALTGRRPQPRA
ncbi:MAG TPA: site-2 protease family protein [Actinomycetales bacterium]|nr:site-2 protease family protein [Actinomycetales bacterium]